MANEKTEHPQQPIPEGHRIEVRNPTPREEYQNISDELESGQIRSMYKFYRFFDLGGQVMRQDADELSKNGLPLYGAQLRITADEYSSVAEDDNRQLGVEILTRLAEARSRESRELQNYGYHDRSIEVGQKARNLAAAKDTLKRFMQNNPQT